MGTIPFEIGVPGGRLTAECLPTSGDMEKNLKMADYPRLCRQFAQ